LRQRSDDGFDAAARKSPHSLLGLATTTSGNVYAADCSGALSSVDSTDCAKPLRPEENNRLSPPSHLGFAASWPAACSSKQLVTVPSTEAWARGPNLRVRGRGRTMREFAARFRARHEVEERHRSEWPCRPLRTPIHAADKTIAFRRHSPEPVRLLDRKAMTPVGEDVQTGAKS
jgi:hypothetical protein